MVWLVGWLVGWWWLSSLPAEESRKRYRYFIRNAPQLKSRTSNGNDGHFIFYFLFFIILLPSLLLLCYGIIVYHISYVQRARVSLYLIGRSLLGWKRTGDFFFFFGSPVGNAILSTSWVVYRIYGWAGPTCDMIPVQYKRTTVDLRIVFP